MLGIRHIGMKLKETNKPTHLNPPTKPNSTQVNPTPTKKQKQPKKISEKQKKKTNLFS